MTSGDIWTRRVLFKLYEHFLNGSNFDDLRWTFDWYNDLDKDENVDCIKHEDRALETLHLAGIIEIFRIPNTFNEEAMNPRADTPEKKRKMYAAWYSQDIAHQTYDSVTAITKFSYERLQGFCKERGISFDTPNDNGGTSVKLAVSYGTPTIELPGTSYTMATLGDGSLTQKIIEHAHKHPGEALSIDELRQHISNSQLNEHEVNLRQVFKSNAFDSKRELGHFADIKAKSFKLNQVAYLLPGHIRRIAKKSR